MGRSLNLDTGLKLNQTSGLWEWSFKLQAPCILYIRQTYRYSPHRHHASYIQDRRTATPHIGTMHPIYRTYVPPLPRVLFLYIQSRNIFNYFVDFLSPSSFIPLQNVVYFLMLPFLVYEIFTLYIHGVLNCKYPAPGLKG